MSGLPSLACQIRLLAVDGLRGCRSGFEVVVVDIRHPRLATVQCLDLEGVLGAELSKLSLEVSCAESRDGLGGEVRDKSCVDAVPRISPERGLADTLIEALTEWSTCQKPTQE